MHWGEWDCALGGERMFRLAGLVSKSQPNPRLKQGYWLGDREKEQRCGEGGPGQYGMHPCYTRKVACSALIHLSRVQRAS